MLIECPECSRKISNQARFCPGCGYEVCSSKTNIKTIYYKSIVPEEYELVKKPTTGDGILGFFVLVAIVIIIAIIFS